jgi:NAD(P)-dependent dehydrogenase (short-subunit alcohol dehydrogenase family)
LINNVGVFNAEPALDIDDDGWRRMFDVNVLSGIRLTRHYAPGMAERRHGRVSFISSEAGVHPPTNMVRMDPAGFSQIGERLSSCADARGSVRRGGKGRAPRPG